MLEESISISVLSGVAFDDDWELYEVEDEDRCILPLRSAELLLGLSLCTELFLLLPETGVDGFVEEAWDDVVDEFPKMPLDNPEDKPLVDPIAECDSLLFSFFLKVLTDPAEFSLL